VRRVINRGAGNQRSHKEWRPATGTAAAKNRAAAWPPSPDPTDQMFADDNVTAIASAVTPWKRAWPGARALCLVRGTRGTRARSLIAQRR